MDSHNILCLGGSRKGNLRNVPVSNTKEMRGIMPTNPDILGSLEKALEETHKELDQIAETLKRKEELEAQERALNLAVAGLKGEELPIEAPIPTNGNGEQHPRLVIGEDKLQRVAEYLRKHKRGARQADIAPALDLNPGTVSVALRKLAESGRAQAGEKREGSTFWTPAGDLESTSSTPKRGPGRPRKSERHLQAA